MEIELEVRRVFYNAKSVITLKPPDGDALRSYSVVSLGPRRYDSLIFHVKLRPGGLFSTLFETLAVGTTLEYLLVNPTLPHYEAAPVSINVVSGGSGMGAVLSRALELVADYRIPQVAIFAINRADLSDYHRGCIETFRRYAACDVHVSTVTFTDWISARFNIHERLAQDALTVGVGSDAIIGRLEALPLSELESFG